MKVQINSEITFPSKFEYSTNPLLNNIIKVFDDLFLKLNAEYGRCTNAKHPVEVEPGATPRREVARRISLVQAERANQEVRILFAFCMIQLFPSPWARGFIRVEKKKGQLLFCCDFRPWNEVTIKDADPLPSIVASLAQLRKAKFILASIWHGLYDKPLCVKHVE